MAMEAIGTGACITDEVKPGTYRKEDIDINSELSYICDRGQ